VKKAGDELEKANAKIRVVHIDMFNIRTEEEFYQAFSEKVIRAVSGKLEDLVINSRKFLKQWLPKITFSPDAQNEISFGLNWTEVKKQPDEILNLPNEIAKEKATGLLYVLMNFKTWLFLMIPWLFRKNSGRTGKNTSTLHIACMAANDTC
jgi:hypothetical protein